MGLFQQATVQLIKCLKQTNQSDIYLKHKRRANNLMIYDRLV